MPYEVHPTGEFKAEVIGHAIASSKNKGTPGVFVNFRTDDHPSVLVRGTFWLTEKTAEYTMEKIRAMGFQGDSIAELNGDCCVGNKCKITIEQETYTGDDGEPHTVAKVNFVNPINSSGGFGVPDHEEDTAKDVSSRFDALLKTVDKHEQVNEIKDMISGADAAAGDGVVGDDNVPF